MKTHLLLISFFLIIAFSSVKAQVFPYLNASTGNEGTFVIDVDSNIYMFHNSQIEKVDKNFNPIWVKTYNGISFFSILLSKNGSLYFIASDTINYYNMSNNMNTKYIGKININGNLAWCKTADNSSLNLSINFYKLLLDRNNDLMASCNLGIIKLDTLGNMYYFKRIQSNLGLIYDLKKTTVLKDSAGYYSFAFAWQAFETSGIGRFEYYEILDTFSVQNAFNEYPQFYTVNNAWFYKSKYDESTYYSISSHLLNIPGVGASFFSIRKHRNGNVIWNKKIGLGALPYIITSFNEDKHKNIVFNKSALSMGYHANYSNDLIKLDSNGVHNSIKHTLINYSWWPPSAQFEQSILQTLYDNNYFYTFVGAEFPSNPLSITILDSSLISSCTYTASVTLLNELTGSMSTDTFLLKQSITPYILQDKAINVAPILNFTIGSNYCTVLNINENSSEKEEFNIYPNPSNNIINIASSNNVEEVSIYDINSKKVLTSRTSAIIDVSKLNSGIYFIKVQTDKGEFSQKFIKE